MKSLDCNPYTILPLASLTSVGTSTTLDCALKVDSCGAAAVPNTSNNIRIRELNAKVPMMNTLDEHNPKKIVDSRTCLQAIIPEVVVTRRGC